jgi:hypothetical protein
MYLLHKRYATDPRHYVRAFLLLQNDVLDLFSYVEPSDRNLGTYSHRIQQLLMRACVEVEANLTAILLDNNYKPSNPRLTMTQYRMVDTSHRLSSYEIRVPGWNGNEGLRRPFSHWAAGSNETLPWYDAYNKSKHNRHEHFARATLTALVDAFCGLGVLLTAQFHNEDYSPGGKSLGVSGACYFYEGDDGMEPSIGDFLRVKYPTDWPLDDRYEFSWPALRDMPDPFGDFDYSRCA